MVVLDTQHEHQDQHATPAKLGRKRDRIQQRHQAASLQRFAYDAACALRAELAKDGAMKVTRDDAQAIGQLVRAWDIAADRLRVLRGKGLPAVVRSKPRAVADIQPLEPA